MAAEDRCCIGLLGFRCGTRCRMCSEKVPHKHCSCEEDHEFIPTPSYKIEAAVPEQPFGFIEATVGQRDKVPKIRHSIGIQLDRHGISWGR